MDCVTNTEILWRMKEDKKAMTTGRISGLKMSEPGYLNNNKAIPRHSQQRQHGQEG